MRIIIFISIFFLIFGLSGYYVYTRTTQAFPGTFVDSVTFILLYILFLSAFFIGKLVEGYSIGFISSALVKIGSIGAGVFLYTFLLE